MLLITSGHWDYKKLIGLLQENTISSTNKKAYILLHHDFLDIIKTVFQHNCFLCNTMYFILDILKDYFEKESINLIITQRIWPSCFDISFHPKQKRGIAFLHATNTPQHTNMLPKFQWHEAHKLSSFFILLHLCSVPNPDHPFSPTAKCSQ